MAFICILFLFPWLTPKVSLNSLSSGYQCWSLAYVPSTLAVLLMAGSVSEKKKNKAELVLGK
jgi:hypothetical protein